MAEEKTGVLADIKKSEERNEVALDGSGMTQGMHQMIRAENESLAMAAVMNPRKLKNVLQEVVEEIELAPSVAPTFIYSIPYKTAGGGTTQVRGLSIRAAEMASRCMGYLSAGYRVIEVTSKNATVEGYCIDLQKGVKQSSQRIISREYRDKYGKTIVMNEKMWDQAILAAGSKVKRSAIEAILPNSVKLAIWEKAEEIIGKQVADRLPKMIEAFADMGVTKEMLEKRLGRPISQMNHKELADYVGMYNAIDSGEITVEQAFADDIEPVGGGDSKKSEGKVTRETVLNKGDAPKDSEKKEEKAEKKAEKKSEKKTENKPKPKPEPSLEDRIINALSGKELGIDELEFEIDDVKDGAVKEALHNLIDDGRVLDDGGTFTLIDEAEFD